MKRKIIPAVLFASLLFTGFANINNKSSNVAATEYLDSLGKIQSLIDGGTTNINLNYDIVVKDSDTDWPLSIESGKTISINGNGHTIRTEHAGTNIYGNIDPDASNVQLINVMGNLEINDLTLRGGTEQAIYVDNGILSVMNCTLERTGSPNSYGGAISATDSNVLIKDSKISRNIADHGGGLVVEGGHFIADGCSFNENRSCSSSGGGGAIEINGGCIAIFNNCTIANNSSTEIGGAINCYSSNLTFLNCNIVGNSTTAGWYCGGGIGDNGSSVNILNCNLTNNYYLGNSEIIQSDIGFYAEEMDEKFFIYGSNYKTAMNSYSETVNLTYDLVPGNKQSTNKDDFYSYTKSASLIFDFITNEFIPSNIMERPILMLNDKNTYESYLSKKSKVLTGGCETFLDYPTDPLTWADEDITVSYKKDGQYQSVKYDENSFYKVATDDTYKINKYQDGRARSNGVIGASGICNGDYCLLTVLPGRACEVTGGSSFGDTFKKGTTHSVSISELDPDNHPFLYWLDVTHNIKYYDITHFNNFVLNENLTIQPVTKETFPLTNDTSIDYKSDFKGYIDLPEEANVGDTIILNAVPDENYELAYVLITNANNGDVTTITTDSFIMPGYEIFVEAVFWTGTNPTGKSLICNGEEQELINPGVSGLLGNINENDDGKFYYSLTGDPSDFSESIPTAKDAGEYTIYWKYFHDQNSSFYGMNYDRSGSVTTIIESNTKVIDLLWLVILLGCLDLVLGSLLVVLLIATNKAKKDNKKMKKAASVTPIIVFIKWQIVLIIIFAVILLGLIVTNIIYFKKYKELKDKQ